ncbi:cardiolipin synthase [Kaarinaea lacus]
MASELILTLVGYAYLVLEIVALLSAIDAVMRARTSQGAIAWAIALVSFPLLSLPLYFVFGRSKFLGYVKARRASHENLTSVFESLQANAPEFRAQFSANEQIFPAFESLASMPFLTGNETNLLIDGEQTFTEIFEGIKAAESYIIVQFYIVKSDELGNRLKSVLLAKLGQGVKVYFLCDAIGSAALPASYLAELQQAGAEAVPFRCMTKFSRRLQINFRNHRKIVVIDGHTAYVGGHNVGDEYLGKHPALSPWRDTHVKVTGPAALTVQLVFVEDWYWVTQEIPPLNWQPASMVGVNQRVLTLPSGPADRLDTCSLFFVHAINSAQQRCWIVSPYFVPDESVVSALQLAALRGVDVRILLPEKADHKLVYLAGFSYFHETIDAGVKLFRYEKGFLHQKVMLVDNQLAVVGTANFDNRSFRLNFEITMVFADQECNAALGKMLENDFANSNPVTTDDYDKRSLLFKLLVRISRLFSPIL